MHKIIKSLPVCMIGLISIILVSCGNADSSRTTSSDTSLNKPAPDNNSATNPSLADTGFVNKDSGKRVQNGDTTH